MGIHALFIDFRKAFDLVDHGLLLRKLTNMNVSKCLILGYGLRASKKEKSGSFKLGFTHVIYKTMPFRSAPGVRYLANIIHLLSAREGKVEELALRFEGKQNSLFPEGTLSVLLYSDEIYKNQKQKLYKVNDFKI